MILAIDIGNSGIKGGLFSSDGLEQVFRITTPREGVEDGYRPQFRRYLDASTIQRIGVASVVPTLTGVIVAVAEEVTGTPAENVHVGLSAPIEMDYETPETLGIDRFAGAVAGFVEFGTRNGTKRPVIVVDAGTALTYEVVDAAGTYLGGMISPGPALLQNALVQQTAQLSSVPLEMPDHPIGRSTAAAIQSGVMNGCVDSIDGALRRLSDVIEGEPVVVMTGGWSDALAPHVSAVDHVDRHLVLKGIRQLMTYRDQ